MKGTIGEGILEWKLQVRSERLGKMRGEEHGCMAVQQKSCSQLKTQQRSGLLKFQLGSRGGWE